MAQEHEVRVEAGDAVEAGPARFLVQHHHTDVRVRKHVAAKAEGRPHVAGAAKGPHLINVQQWMKTCVQPTPHPEKVAEVALNPQGGVAGKARMRVYADGYLGRMHEALKEAYEAVRHFIGDRAFVRLAEDYARTYPSHDYNLSLAGRHLPALLKSWPLTKQFPFLSDLAQLEWQVSLSFHAFDPAPLKPQELAAVDPEDWDRLRLFVRPSVFLLASPWPVLDYWAARQQPLATIKIQGKHPQKVLIRRIGTDVGCEIMEDAAFDFLAGIQRGEVLGNLFQALAENEEQEAAEIQHWFAHWSALGLFSGFQILAGETRPV